ncbi:hypothetical protein [Bradyrhizobium elkanii]|uniref:hypothetical protein n=1 Tax=Bradyrhizobium elkanii TaxID=29448 RepID=UPI002168513D|nr:hypothetical protein [Bradyrhizobium elkanii]MCS3689075.1 hypothetical protein [Bradyrhizobium elkanii]
MDHLVSHLRAALDRSLGVLKELCLSVPGQLSARLAHQDRATIHRELDQHMRALLNSIADGALVEGVKRQGPLPGADDGARQQ